MGTVNRPRTLFVGTVRSSRFLKVVIAADGMNFGDASLPKQTFFEVRLRDAIATGGIDWIRDLIMTKNYSVYVMKGCASVWNTVCQEGAFMSLCGCGDFDRMGKLRMHLSSQLSGEISQEIVLYINIWGIRLCYIRIPTHISRIEHRSQLSKNTLRLSFSSKNIQYMSTQRHEQHWNLHTVHFLHRQNKYSSPVAILFFESN